MGKRRRSEDEADASERPRRGRLHLIVHDYKRGCTVYKLDVDAFQPDTGTDDHLESRALRLPHDCVAIRMASPDRHQCDQFVCTGSKIFAFYKDADAGRSTVVYDSATSQVAVCPPLLARKVLAEFLTVGLDIYALETDLTGYNFVPSMQKLGPGAMSSHPKTAAADALPGYPSRTGCTTIDGRGTSTRASLTWAMLSSASSRSSLAGAMTFSPNSGRGCFFDSQPSESSDSVTARFGRRTCAPCFTSGLTGSWNAIVLLPLSGFDHFDLYFSSSEADVVLVRWPSGP